jgi:O-antigen/teichoic acid export membrane protein
MTNRYDHSRKRIVSGFATSVIQFVLQIITAIVLVPVYITQLGYEVYYLIPLVASISAYLTTVAAVLNTSYARIVGVAMHYSTERISETTMWLYLIMSILIVIAATALTPPLVQWLLIPNTRVQEVTCFLLLYFVSVAVSVLGGNYGSVLYALGRIDQRNISEMCGFLIRTLLIGVVLVVLPRQLIPIGAAFLLGSIATVVMMAYQLRMIDSTYLRGPKQFDPRIALQLLKTSGWLLLAQMGAVLLTRTDVLLAKSLVGDTAAGVFGALVNWTALLRAALGVSVNVLTPRLFNAHGRGDTEYLRKTAVQFSRMIGVAFALPTGLICGFAMPMLSVWLGGEAKQHAGILVALTSHFSMSLPLVIVTHIAIAMNRVKIAAFASLGSGLLAILLMYFFGGVMGMGLVGIAIGGSVALLLKDALFGAWYLARLLQMKMSILFNITLVSAGLFSVVSLLAYIISVASPFDATTTLLLGGFVLSVGYAILVWRRVVNKVERNTIMALLCVNR